MGNYLNFEGVCGRNTPHTPSKFEVQKTYPAKYLTE